MIFRSLFFEGAVRCDQVVILNSKSYFGFVFFGRFVLNEHGAMCT
jgi:hypothetical protein